jgi:hypothetical protein
MVVLILYQYDIKYVTKCNTKFKKCRKYGTLRVDLTGVEPIKLRLIMSAFAPL